MENVTSERFCMGVFYDTTEYIIVPSRCLSMYPKEKLLNAYTGFDSWDFNVTSNATNFTEANPNLIEFEIKYSKSEFNSIQV
jgi:hypothetical protein